jgi:hypothetical protein
MDPSYIRNLLCKVFAIDLALVRRDRRSWDGRTMRRPFGLVDGAIAVAIAAVYAGFLWWWPGHVASGAAAACAGTWYAATVPWFVPLLAAPIGLVAAGVILLFRRDPAGGWQDALLFLGTGAMFSVPLAGYVPWWAVELGYCVADSGVAGTTLRGAATPVPWTDLSKITEIRGSGTSLVLRGPIPGSETDTVEVLQIDLDGVVDPDGLRADVLRHAATAGLSSPVPPGWQPLPR